MHELTIAEDILNLVEDAVKENKGHKACRVKVAIGQYSCVDKGSLTFCLNAISAGTFLEDAEIEIKETDFELACDSCGHFPLKSEDDLFCPNCGKSAKIADAKEVFIEEIEIDE